MAEEDDLRTYYGEVSPIRGMLSSATRSARELINRQEVTLLTPVRCNAKFMRDNSSGFDVPIAKNCQQDIRSTPSSNVLRGSPMMKNLITLYCALLPALGLAQELKPLPEVFSSSAPKVAPALKLLQGNPPTAFEYKPKRPTLVHFWATWCAPCVVELPALARSAEPLMKSGIDLVIVSVDVGAATKVPSFLAKLGIKDTPVYWDPRSELYKKFAVSILPTTVALDATGREIGRTAGAALWSGESDAKFLASKMLR